MALEKMSTTAILVLVFAFAGLCQGEDQQCSTNQVDVFSKMVTCITKDHPEYFITVFTKIKKPTAMEDPEFMCNNQGMLSAMVECLLEYMQGCFPPAVASQVAEVMPSHETIQKGVSFVCRHRKEFDNPCVLSHVTKLMGCLGTKMQTYTQVTRSASRNMRDILCMALQREKQCIDSSLAQCPQQVRTDLKNALTAFFPSENCPRRTPYSYNVLRYQPEGPH